MENKVHISIKIPTDFHKELKQISVREQRSLSQELIVLLKRGLESEATKQLKLFE